MKPANDNRQERTQGFAEAGRHRLFVLVASGVVGLAILAGIAVSDPPWVVRDRRLDQTLVTHLNAVQNAINVYHRNNAKLPAALPDLLGSPQTTPFGLNAETLKDIEYTAGPDPRSYELCAHFLRPSGEEPAYYAQSWSHEAGRACFKLQVPEKSAGLEGEAWAISATDYRL